MKKTKTIFCEGTHRWLVVARDPDRPDHVIDTNEYLIQHESAALLTDPGGLEIFPAVFSALSASVNPACISHIFASHQDPDVISSLGLWLEFNPKIRCYLSWLWQTFIPHFGGNASTFIPVPDDGLRTSLGTLDLEIVPAHYLHSSGNLHLYDPKAAILFSGDVGAAILPPDAQTVFVEDFDRHIPFADGFHRRWMGSGEAKRRWCERVSGMRIEMLCPQHGAIYQGRDVERFINWFADLPIGVMKSG